MNVSTLASVTRARWLAIAATALISACSSGGGSDAGNDTGAVDASDATDAPRIRDTGADISTDSAASQCLLMITPRTGPVTGTFTINGTNFVNTQMAALTVALDGSSGTPAVNTNVTIASDGTFTYTIAANTLTPGNYTVSVNDPTFTCSISSPLTAQ